MNFIPSYVSFKNCSRSQLVFESLVLLLVTRHHPIASTSGPGVPRRPSSWPNSAPSSTSSDVFSERDQPRSAPAKQLGRCGGQAGEALGLAPVAAWLSVDSSPQSRLDQRVTGVALQQERAQPGASPR